MDELVKKAITIINDDLEMEELENLKEDTPLFDILDSVAVLDLILEIESLLEDKYGRYIQIADEMTMDANLTPFKTFGKLVKYLEEKIDG